MSAALFLRANVWHPLYVSPPEAYRIVTTTEAAFMVSGNTETAAEKD